MTHYEILGVPVGADSSEIRKAWITKAKELHPDVNKSAGANERYLAVKDAYEVLSDPDKRAQYDLSLYAPKSQATSQPFNDTIRNAQRAACNPAFGPAFVNPFENAPNLSDVLGQMVDGMANGYIGRNPLLRAAYKRVRPEIHDSLRTVLKEFPPEGKKQRARRSA